VSAINAAKRPANRDRRGCGVCMTATPVFV
jgi:hypothetical protein